MIGVEGMVCLSIGFVIGMFVTMFIEYLVELRADIDRLKKEPTTK